MMVIQVKAQNLGIVGGTAQAAMLCKCRFLAQESCSKLGFDPGSEGLINPDAEMHLISMPPVLLVAAHRFMAPVNNRLVWVPLLHQLTDEWRQQELTDVSNVVAKLLFWHDILHQPVVLLGDLLGGRKRRRP